MDFLSFTENKKKIIIVERTHVGFPEFTTTPYLDGRQWFNEASKLIGIPENGVIDSILNTFLDYNSLQKCNIHINSDIL